MPIRMHDDEVLVDDALVRRLLASQMPQLAGLPLVVVEPWGTDHAIWRVGEDLVVRLPRIHWAAGQAELEARWLPVLAPLLPVEVPEPVALGVAADGYPFPWCVQRWIDGAPATRDRLADPVSFAFDLAAVLHALQACPSGGAPSATNRARALAEYDAATRWAIEHASDLIDIDAATAVWEAALDAPPYDGPDVWVQGDLEGNCIVRDGQLAGIVDWGSACVGDPAVDVQVVWSPLFTDQSRGAFLDVLEIDDATLARSRGAALNQACMALPYYRDTYPLIVERSWHKLDALGVRPARHDAVDDGPSNPVS